MMSREATARAAEVWRLGYSAGLIAEAVGSTRSAVVAKLRRLGIKRAVQSPSASLRPPPAKPRKPKPKLMLVCEPLWIEFCGAATRSLSSSWCPAHKLICCATDARTRA
jgi:hypothetical protein